MSLMRCALIFGCTEPEAPDTRPGQGELESLSRTHPARLPSGSPVSVVPRSAPGNLWVDGDLAVMTGG